MSLLSAWSISLDSTFKLYIKFSGILATTPLMHWAMDISQLSNGAFRLHSRQLDCGEKQMMWLALPFGCHSAFLALCHLLFGFIALPFWLCHSALWLRHSTILTKWSAFLALSPWPFHFHSSLLALLLCLSAFTLLFWLCHSGISAFTSPC